MEKTGAHIFFEEGDKYLPTEKNLELLRNIPWRPTPSEEDMQIARYNLSVVSRYATTFPQNGDLDPHSDILYRTKLIKEFEISLFDNNEQRPLISSAQ